jgi:hypothetical protein
MKTILFVLAVTCSQISYAQSVMINPTIFNFGSSIQVQVNNLYDFNISCSGTVQAQTMLGRSETFYYNDYIRSRSFSYRSYNLMNMSDRITNTFPFIRCYKAQ